MVVAGILRRGAVGGMSCGCACLLVCCLVLVSLIVVGFEQMLFITSGFVEQHDAFELFDVEACKFCLKFLVLRDVTFLLFVNINLFFGNFFTID